jgi:hypothetical protein
MKREKRLTKKERKATAPAQIQPAGAGQPKQHGHIHCIACGKHLDAQMFGEADGAAFLRCEHGSDFPACIACEAKARELIAEHDRTNKPVKKAEAWH